MIDVALALLAGLLIGSFLNVCIYRLPEDLSVVRPRSYCPGCKHTVSWYDNVPLLSFLLLRGRCRHCNCRIPVRYPLVELLTGLLFAAAVWHHGPTAPALKLAIFAAIMIELIFSDLGSRILPDEFTIGGTIVGILLAFLVPMDEGIVSVLLSLVYQGPYPSVLQSVIGAGLAAGLLWAVGWVFQKVRRKEGLGLGDVKMLALLGAFLGFYQTLITLIIGTVAGSVIGLAFILLARKDAGTYELPYGTFIGAGALVYVFVWKPFVM